MFEPENYQIICKELDTEIKKYWDLDEIKMIEGLLKTDGSNLKELYFCNTSLQLRILDIKF